MSTPYPSSNPGHVVDASKIAIPAWINAALTEEHRRLAMHCYQDGYQTGWVHSSDQYTTGGEPADFLYIIDYILRRKNSLNDSQRAKVLSDIRAVLPPSLGGKA